MQINFLMVHKWWFNGVINLLFQKYVFVFLVVTVVYSVLQFRQFTYFLSRWVMLLVIYEATLEGCAVLAVSLRKWQHTNIVCLWSVIFYFINSKVRLHERPYRCCKYRKIESSFWMKAKFNKYWVFHVVGMATEHFCTNTVNLYWRGAWFESRTRYWLSWVKFFVIFPVSSKMTG
jgi:hypothetical protein